MKLLANWKTGTARALAIGGVAMGLTGTMALQQAAPAEALIFLAPLAPVVGAAVGGTGITAAGWATLAGGAAAIGAALHFGSPAGADDLDRAIDWLMEPVDLFGRPINPETGEETDDAKDITAVPEVVWTDPNCTHPDCFKEPWVNGLWKYNNATFSTILMSGQRGVSIKLTLKGQNNLSGGREYASAMVTKTCKHPTSGAVLIKEELHLMGVGVAFASYDQQTSHEVYCSSTEGELQHVMLEPPTREEYTTVMGPSTNGPKYDNGGPGETITYVPDGASAVDGKIRTTVVCRDAAGVETTITADSPTSAPSLTIPSCSSRGLGEAVSVTSDFYQGETKMKNVFSGSGLSGAGQKLEIWVDGMPCQVGWQACESWPGLSVTAPERVKCYLGGAEVALSQCNYLEGAYLVGGTPATKTNIDGNPATWTPPSTIPGWIPHEETASGPQPNPNITPSPDPNPTPEPSIKPEPAPNTGTAPGTGTSTGGSTVTNPGTVPGGYGGNCWSGTSAWNPIEWVYMPVSCALQAAFVPTLNITARLESIGQLLQTKPPFVWLNEGIAGPAATGCPNWVVTVGGLSKNVVCDSSFTAAIVGARSPLFVLMSTAMVWPLIRSLWYASIPFVKATPTGGK